VNIRISNHHLSTV